MNQSSKRLIEIALMSALGIILSLIPLQLGVINISLSLIPVILIALRYDLFAAFSTGLLIGFLKLLLGNAQILTPMQGILEYLLAFALAGIGAGLFAKVFQQHPSMLMIILATFTSTLCRYSCHFIAGGIFWTKYAPQSFNPWLFSLIVNGLSGLLTSVICSIVLVLLFHYFPILFVSAKKLKK